MDSQPSGIHVHCADDYHDSNNTSQMADTPGNTMKTSQSRWRSCLAVLCRLLVPTFLISTPPSELSRTACLDGLRGIGAVCVVNYHILMAFEYFVNYSYGLSPEAGHEEPSCAHRNESYAHNNRFHQLPIIRLVYSGSAAVCIFFVLSGFVLSYRSWKLLRSSPSPRCGLNTSDTLEKIYHSLSSSALRRFSRLFLPTIIITFMTLIFIQLGIWEYSESIVNDPSILAGEPEHHQPRFDSFFTQLWHWLWMLHQMLNFGYWGEFYPAFDVHLWTIPMEYRNSMFLFLVLFVVVRLKYQFRFTLLMGLVIYSYTMGRWDTVLFFSGAILSETSLIYDSLSILPQLDVSSEPQYESLSCGSSAEAIESDTRPPNQGSRARRKRSYIKRYSESFRFARPSLSTIFRALLLLISFYLMSAPDYCVARTPGYRILGSLILPGDEREARYYPSLGAILLVGVVAHCPREAMTVRILENRMVQYFGRISFSLYLVHGPVLHGFGYAVFAALWGLLGHDGWGYRLGLGFGWLIVMTAAIYIADRVTVFIDEPCLKFGRILEKWVVE